jgi:acetyl esterase/lipase
VRRVTASHDGFERAFGADWRCLIPPAQGARLPNRRWAWRMSPSPELLWERDIPFWTVPIPSQQEQSARGRRLLCDIWRLRGDMAPSGLVLVYIHGGGWRYMDKDLGTRPLFRHLVAQGHVVMDVAYRLCPETDLFGMVGDVKRAIAWMKAHSSEYHVSPERIVIAGGSAGGHLALLAAYAPHDVRLTPDELIGIDLSVRAVVAYYPAVDMRATYEKVMGIQASRGPVSHVAARVQTALKAIDRHRRNRTGELGSKGQSASMFRRLVDSNAQSSPYSQVMACLLGGQPDETPEMYDLASPLSHVSPASPPTLLFQGTHDWHMPLSPARALARKLRDAKVPVVYVEFPQTDHAFDLIALPRLSPSVQASLYDLDHFLALML